MGIITAKKARKMAATKVADYYHQMIKTKVEFSDALSLTTEVKPNTKELKVLRDAGYVVNIGNKVTFIGWA